jgi:hypothetical protein
MPCVSLVVTTQAARSADQLSELKAIVPQWRAGFRSDPVRWKPARERVGRVTHLLRHIIILVSLNGSPWAALLLCFYGFPTLDGLS